MNHEKFENLDSAWISNLRRGIDKNTAQPGDLLLFMEYYCHMYQSGRDIPLNTLREILKLINQSFSKYLERKEFDGGLEAAFGFTRKQADRKLGRRKEDIATDVARYRLKGKSLPEALAKVSARRDNLSHSTIKKAWEKFKETGYIRAQIEYGAKGKSLSTKRHRMMQKDLKK